jgi:hypothetical protein
MCYCEPSDSLLMELLVNRCGNDDCLERADLEAVQKSRAVVELSFVTKLAYARSDPLGNLVCLAFSRSVDDQSSHRVSWKSHPPACEARQRRASANFAARTSCIFALHSL